MAKGCPTSDDIEKMNLDHFLDKEVDLSQYFSKQELETISSQQQTRLKNVADNYGIMLNTGLPAIKPDFMKGHTHGEKQVKLKEQRSLEPVMETKTFSDSDSDETCTPDRERKNRAKGKKISKKHNLENGETIDKKIKRERKSDDEIFEKNVDELRERSANFMHMEAPADDQFLHCEDCNNEYDMDCPVHGPLDYIRDTEVYTENDPERALHTLPLGLVVKESSIVGAGAGVGVFTEKEIPPRVMFGPYGGVKIYDKVKAHDSEYCWQISKDGKPNHFVDGKDKAHSNWMRYVNCAPNESEQNLVAFQFKGGIYYRSCKTISPGSELLYWYGNEYGRELALVRDKNLLVKPELVNGKDCYQCVFCKIAFTTDVDNIRHLVRTHGKDELSQSDIYVLDEWLIKNEKEELSTRRKNETHKIHLDTNEQNVSEQGETNEQMKAVQNISDNESESTISCDQKSTKDLIKEVRTCKYDVCDQINHMKRHTGIQRGEKCFKCDVCDYSSNRSSDLKRHIRIHTGEKCFNCNFCDYTSNRSSDLKRHMRIHTEEKCFKCDFCEFVCYRGIIMKRHMKIHRGEKRFKCDNCDYASNRNGNLKIHMKIHSGEKCFKCNVCDYASNQSSTLKRHMRKHSGEKCFKCDVCDYASNLSGNLKTHMRIHTGEKCFKCDVCDYASNDCGNLKTHMRIHTGEKCFKCDVCDYASNRSSDMKRHMRMHTGEKCFKCDVCKFACNRSITMKRHMRKHTGMKCFEYDVCAHACNQSCTLKRHMSIHREEKCFKCDVCDYVSNHSSTLKRHVKIHTGERFFKCDVCDYECIQSCHLKRHVSKHTGEKCFKCNICDYACIKSSILKKHMRIHTGEKLLKCDICDYACIKRSTLKNHIRIHTGEKCFKCDICDYACIQSSTLKRHMRIHTGEKNFKCVVCDYGCNQSNTLKRHMRIHVEREIH